MIKYKPDRTFRKWIESKAVVVAGYFDEVVNININSLLAIWIDGGKNPKESFSDQYPHAADYFQVTVVEKDDPRLEEPGVLLRILKDYRYCHHLKVWSDGELLDDLEVHEILVALQGNQSIESEKAED
jgi:hypothetical protein